jgi:serine/threonine protein phosphatase PrpC
MRLKDGDKLLIGSDGFWDYVRQKKIIKHLNKEKEDENLAKRLANAAKDNKTNTDDITVIVANIIKAPV